MPLILRIAEIPNSMASHAEYRFRYVVAYWGQNEFGLAAIRQQRYAGTEAGQEELVKERFLRDFSNLEIRGVWQEV
jgi:hypothetical protein